MFTGRLLGGTSSTERPLIRISPLVGARKPAIIRMIVVLPQPDGPRMEKNEPGGTSKETFSTALSVAEAFRQVGAFEIGDCHVVGSFTKKTAPAVGAGAS